MNAAVDKPPVDVVMATYDGARYLPQMLASLVAQQWPSLRLIVCDDGSTDGTIEILESFRDLPVKLVRNPVNLGARENFSQALRLAEAGYVALADQDDVWMPDKLSITVAALRRLEQGSGIPALVYSDLKIVDADLSLLSPSFYDGTFKSRDARALANFAVSNHVPGCAMLVNRALLDVALPIPTVANMHDWWLCIVAAAVGTIDHVREPLVLFRRHDTNATASGEQKLRASWIGKALRRALTPLDYFRTRRDGTGRHAEQINSLLAAVDQRYAGRMRPDAKAAMHALKSTRLLSRYTILRRAHTGDSPVSDVLHAIQMGVPAHRAAFRRSSEN